MQHRRLSEASAHAQKYDGVSLKVEVHADLLALMQRFELCYELPSNAPSAWRYVYGFAID